MGEGITFDVYGTLIDWEPSIISFLRRWADQNSVLLRERISLYIAADLTIHARRVGPVAHQAAHFGILA
jgi:FMN phosphatase YigB (HAD superfamily)